MNISRLASWGRALVACVGLALLTPHGAAASTGTSEAIVQFTPGTSADERLAAVDAVGGEVIRDLPLIHGLGARLPEGAGDRLAAMSGVRVVSPNAAARSTVGITGSRWGDWQPEALATAYNHSTRAEKAWTDPNSPATGRGVTVAVIDTGVAGDLPDFDVSDTDTTSRVIATAVTNPDATTANDVYGHGTHVAGLLAGNNRTLPADDPLAGRYIGSAPEAEIVSIKASDDHGNSSLIDVIAGVQFAVDHREEYGIRVINLSMSSTEPQSYKTDPLDAAVEAAWFSGIVVVVAAGNRGTAADAVSYAPANDPYVISVGGVDDKGTKDTTDDTLAGWSSRGVTQDGFAKPELVAPGAHIEAPLAPGSDLPSLCAECVVGDGRYFRMGGTSMAAPIVSGVVASVLSVHPEWTPDQVKGALTHFEIGEDGVVDSNVRLTADGAHEVAADNAVNASESDLVANEGLTPNEVVDPETGDIDYTRASWGRASWSEAADALRASWGRASWGCDCSGMTGEALPTRASWGRASWSTFFGETPDEFGELAGGTTGKVVRRADPAADPAPAVGAAGTPEASVKSVGVAKGKKPAAYCRGLAQKRKCGAAMRKLARKALKSPRRACAPLSGKARQSCVKAGKKLLADRAR